MYADRIRLVSTEKGVGANLKNVISTKGDTAINVAEKVTLDNILAKKDLNIVGKEITVTASSNLFSNRDTTLVSQQFNNSGKLIAGRDMRIFSDQVRNVGLSATLYASDNLWIQKDADGNKNTIVKNESGSIKTKTGDVIVRTERLDNSRQVFNTEWSELEPDSSAIKIHTYDENYQPYKKEVELTGEIYPVDFPEQWFGTADFRIIHENEYWHLYKINTERSLYEVAGSTPAARIYASGNLYINASQLNNEISSIRAGKDIFLTGNDFLNSSHSDWIKDDFEDYEVQGGMHHRRSAMQTEWYTDWTEADRYPDSITAGGNLALDFNNSIHLQMLSPEFPDVLGHRILLKEKILPAVRGNNIVLHANTITNNDLIEARGDITLIADDTIDLNNSALRGRDISLTALNDIN